LYARSRVPVKRGGSGEGDGGESYSPMRSASLRAYGFNIAVKHCSLIVGGMWLIQGSIRGVKEIQGVVT
jgi:hypothetical protein